MNGFGKIIAAVVLTASVATHAQQSINVGVGDLDLATAKGQQAMALRVDRAARTRYQDALTPLGLGLEGRLEAKAGTLSGGQRQALSLVMAVLRRPSLLLLDEHTAALDPRAAEAVMQATIRAVEASVYRAGYPADAAAVLLVELDGPAATVAEEAAEVQATFARHGALHSEEATDPAERKRLWKGRKGAFGAMGRLNTDLYVLDGVVPRTRLEEALARITAIGEKHGVVLTNVFHAGDGNLHPNISFDGRDAAETARTIAAGREILQVCVDLGGSVTGEHGIGAEKLDHIGLMYGPDDLDVMARVRAVWNPLGLCNPGKVLPQRAACAEVAKWPQMVARILDGDRS